MAENDADERGESEPQHTAAGQKNPKELAEKVKAKMLYVGEENVFVDFPQPFTTPLTGNIMSIYSIAYRKNLTEKDKV